MWDLRKFTVEGSSDFCLFHVVEDLSSLRLAASSTALGQISSSCAERAADLLSRQSLKRENDRCMPHVG